MSKKKLKLCPHCKCIPVKYEIKAHTHIYATFMPDYEGGWFVECCGDVVSGKTEEEAIEAWNRRVQE